MSPEGTRRNLEDDRETVSSSANPFLTEKRLYEKECKPGDCRVTVVVPDEYAVALPNLGHQVVEHQVNQEDGFFADRAYLTPEHGLLKEVPDLSPEIVMMSMSYEGSYIRSARALDLMGIPPAREGRAEDDPLVVFGGWSVSRNPLPLFPLADVICVGSSENLVKAITEAKKQCGGLRERMFDILVHEPGIIIPSRYNVETEGGYLARWDATGAPVDIYAAVSEMMPHSWYMSGETDYNYIGLYERQMFFSMELVDACRSKCLYCASGHRVIQHDIQGPQQIAALGEWAAGHGADLIKLFFPANSTVEGTKDIMREMLVRGLRPRVGSAKAEKIDREYIELVAKSGQEKVAYAPETGEEALRRALGKPGMTDEVLRNVVAVSVGAGIPNLDFYMILNLPGEAPDSVDQNIALMTTLEQLARSNGLQGRVRLSMPNFFPKANTPFQYARAGGIEDYFVKLKQMRERLGSGVTVSGMDESVDLLSQNIMSRGGIEAGHALLEVYKRLKSRERQEGRFIPDTMTDWREALASVGAEEDDYFKGRTVEKPLPWHHIHSGRDPVEAMVKMWEVFKARRAGSVFIVD